MDSSPTLLCNDAEVGIQTLPGLAQLLIYKYIDRGSGMDTRFSKLLNCCATNHP
jgi:hypothetical protein